MIDDDFDDIFKRITRMFDDEFTGGYMRRYPSDTNTREYLERDMNILEDDTHIYYTTELRIPDEDLDVEIERDKIIIQAMVDGNWKRKSVSLPATINKSTAKVTFKNGVLDFELEKIDESKGTKRISKE